MASSSHLSNAAETACSIRGVLFSRSIRAHYAILHLSSEESGKAERRHVIVRLQFEQQADEQHKELRSWCRRLFKLGVLLHIKDGTWTSLSEGCATEWKQDRYVLKLNTISQTKGKIQAIDTRCWDMTQCQTWQEKYLSITNKSAKQNESKALTADNSQTENGTKSQSKKKRNQHADDSLSSPQHGGGLSKRIRGEIITNFLIHIIMEKLYNTQYPMTRDSADLYLNCIPAWEGTALVENIDLRRQAIQFLNSGSGVIDAAGGSGHVSMAMGMAGIQSTVVDPRESVGKLPKRDRKIWSKALKRNNTFPVDTSDSDKSDNAVVPYSTLRAWFGDMPVGVDTKFRQLDQGSVAYCGETSDSLISRCSAIVALHPDEATDAVVDVAVRCRIPFAIVPCCVFGRLFPHRKKTNSNETVSTYIDLLQYLMAKHPSIQASKLPFDGANVVLWSTFEIHGSESE